MPDPPIRVHRPGWRESVGAVLVAGLSAFAVGRIADHFVPGFVDEPLGSLAVELVVFVAILWTVALLLVPGRRPRSLPREWAPIGGSVAAGLLIAAITIAGTWAYLSSIEIDDGLEGLMFFPLLVTASLLVAVVARRWSARFRPIIGSVAGCVGVAVVLIALSWSRGGPSAASTVGLTVLVLFPLTLASVATGTVLGDLIRGRREGHRDRLTAP